ncbi:hypothetical protein DIPPA_04586 [Diplonema papillatum]|nr:hypothetical protein DIPPA_04586 [Diplonema papillatum]|eukprot:gene5966-9160_t
MSHMVPSQASYTPPYSGASPQHATPANGSHAVDAALAQSMPSARPPDFQGILKKKGVTPGWRERYFKLFDHMLVYFKDNEMKGELNLQGARAEILSESGVFQLTGPMLKRQEIKLDADSWHCMEKWLRKLGKNGVDVGKEFAPTKSTSRPDPQKWACSRCTLLNKPLTAVCDACGWPKEKSTLTPDAIATAYDALPMPVASGTEDFDLKQVDVTSQIELMSQIALGTDYVPGQSPPPEQQSAPLPAKPTVSSTSGVYSLEPATPVQSEQKPQTSEATFMGSNIPIAS